VYSCFALKSIEILEKTVREVVTEPVALLLVEQRAFNQIMAGFNSELDSHQSLP